MIIRHVYITLIVVILLAEISIAVGLISGTFIRGSIGDILVIALIYFLLRTITGLTPQKAACLAIALGFLVEALQYLHVVDLMNIRYGSILYIIVGNTFSIYDLVMYLVGGCLALVVDRYILLPRSNSRGHKPFISLVL